MSRVTTLQSMTTTQSTIPKSRQSSSAQSRSMMSSPGNKVGDTGPKKLCESYTSQSACPKTNCFWERGACHLLKDVAEMRLTKLFMTQAAKNKALKEIDKLKEDARVVKLNFNNMITELKRTEIVNARMRRKMAKKEQKEGRRNLKKMLLQEKIDKAEQRQIEELGNTVSTLSIVQTLEQIKSLIKQLEEEKENGKKVKDIEDKFQALMDILIGLL